MSDKKPWEVENIETYQNNCLALYRNRKSNCERAQACKHTCKKTKIIHKKSSIIIEDFFISPYKTTCFAGGHVLKAMPIFV
jgi:hypothetical protein